MNPLVKGQDAKTITDINTDLCKILSPLIDYWILFNAWKSGFSQELPLETFCKLILPNIKSLLSNSNTLPPFLLSSPVKDVYGSIQHTNIRVPTDLEMQNGQI